MDSYKNETYVNGQAGSIYKQSIPLANVNRPPAEWNVYDIIWIAPTFNDNGTVKTKARVTAFLNGVLVQNNYEVQGETAYIGTHDYVKHGPSPNKLQAPARVEAIVVYFLEDGATATVAMRSR